MPFNECNETLTFFNMLANLPAFRDGISESQVNINRSIEAF